MANVNIIFKNTQYRLGLGGTMPPNVHIKGSNGYYYHGETDPENLDNILRWEPLMISQEASDGFKFLDVIKVRKFPDDMDNDELRYLTVAEKVLKKAAEKVLKKLQTRSKISGEVGDVYDLIADLSQRVALVERLAASTANFLYTTSSIKDEFSQEYKDLYGALANRYITKVEDGTDKDRIDLDTYSNTVEKLIAKNNKITEIVTEYVNF